MSDKPLEIQTDLLPKVVEFWQVLKKIWRLCLVFRLEESDFGSVRQLFGFLCGKAHPETEKYAS